MQSIRLRTSLGRVVAQRRLIATTSARSAGQGRDSSLSQGHVTDPNQQHPQDPHSQSARSGLEGKESTPFDAAASRQGAKAPSGASGNREGVGFAEQVGSASATAGGEFGESTVKGAEEEAQAPGMFSSMKQALGLGTTGDDVKQNKGGGEGVTGTGTNPLKSRGFHTSVAFSADKTAGQAHEASRQPKEETYEDQNEHLKHKKNAGEKDGGKGNAAEDPVLPSHQETGPAGYNKGHAGSGYGGEKAERFT
ncbi:hypothetical protein HYDPIDRAFT_22853 [Hydnomerulius pinastri MD-312]|nr:hypothetical protein HYDPIDRAFT_22853 [Hydnomerulius pinastri MD-312]